MAPKSGKQRKVGSAKTTTARKRSSSTTRRKTATGSFVNDTASKEVPPPPYFFTFNQNNSGGSFDQKMGHFVIIEAHDLREAVRRAKDIGLYFDGVARGRDCGCCGDRWSTYASAYVKPAVYGQPAHLHGGYRWFDNDIHVHYLDGRKEVFTSREKEVKDCEKVESVDLPYEHIETGRWVEYE